MVIEELKKIIESKQVPEQLIILKWSDSDFIPNQYIDFIKKNTEYEVEFVSNYDELISITTDIFSFNSSNKTLNILKEDTFCCEDEQLKKVTYCIIVCNKIDKKVESIFKDHIIEIPKLEKWQIKDYAYSIAQGIDSKNLDKLIENCNYDIYRLSQELDKISIFSENNREFIFNKLEEDNAFIDLNNYTIFTFTTALLKRDVKSLFKVYSNIKYIDIEPIGFLILLCQNFKDVINVQLSVNSSPEILNMNPKKYWAVKYSCGFYSKEELMSIYEFLTGLDKRIKVGEMPMDILVDYIITKVIACGY